MQQREALATAQEAYDLMVMAPRIAEHPDVFLPVLVCQDGFTITHSAEPVVLLGDLSVKRFVGEYHIPFPLLDLSAPTTQGPFAMPDYYYEVRHQQVAAMSAALAVFEDVAAEFETVSGRRYDVIVVGAGAAGLAAASTAINGIMSTPIAPVESGMPIVVFPFA